jgi:hypothetical protein
MKSRCPGAMIRAQSARRKWRYRTGQEADCRRCSGVGERGAGDVEQFPALLVFEDPQLVLLPFTTWPRRMRPHQAWMPATVAGPKAAR